MDDTLRINVVVNNGASSALNSITNSTDKTSASTDKLTGAVNRVLGSLGLLKTTTAIPALKGIVEGFKATTKATERANAKFNDWLKLNEELDVSDFWDQDAQKYTEFGESIIKAEAKTIRWTRALVGVNLALAAIAIKLTNLAIKAAKAGDEIKDNAQKVFMSATAYQEWGYVLEQNGVEVSALNTAMRTFAKSVPDGKDINEEFEKTVYTIQSLTSETEKVALATEKFGNRALELMPVFNQSVSDTQRLLKEYRLLGGTMSNELIAKSDVLTDSITAMKAAWKGLGNTLGSLVMPAITKVVKWLTLAIAYVNVFIKAVFGIKESFGGIDKGSSKLAKNLGGAVKSAKELKKTLFGFDELNVLNGDSGAGADDLGIDTGIGAGFNTESLIDDEQLAKLEKFKEKLAEIDLTWVGIILKVVAIAAPIALAITAVGNLVKAIKGIQAAIGLVSSPWTLLIAAVIAGIILIIANWDKIKEAIINTWETVKTNFGLIKDWAIGVWNSIIEKATSLWDKVKTGFSNMWTAVKDAAKGPLNSVIGFLNKVIGGINKIKLPNWGILGGAAGKGINIPLIPTLATGGMVGAGQLFIANEAGPELIGSYGNKSAVMNNEQIVDAVARGVASAIGNQNIQLNVDGQKLFDILVNRNNRQVMMTGSSPLMV